MSSTYVHWRGERYRLKTLLAHAGAAPRLARDTVELHPSAQVEPLVTDDELCIVIKFEGLYVELVGRIDAGLPICLLSGVLMKKARVVEISDDEIAVPTTPEELLRARRQSYVSAPQRRNRRY